MDESERELIYIYETTFHLWQQPSHFWLQKGMALMLPDNHSSSSSLLVVISLQRGLVYYEVFTR